MSSGKHTKNLMTKKKMLDLVRQYIGLKDIDGAVKSQAMIALTKMEKDSKYWQKVVLNLSNKFEKERPLLTAFSWIPTTEGYDFWEGIYDAQECKIKETNTLEASEEVGKIRTFGTGATRDTDDDKPDYEGFLSPLVITRYGVYMTKHRRQKDGSLRDSDNWQKGIPLNVYMKSGFRHFMDVWKEHRGIKTQDGIEESLCALLFNVSGYLHEHLKSKVEGNLK